MSNSDIDITSERENSTTHFNPQDNLSSKFSEPFDQYESDNQNSKEFANFLESKEKEGNHIGTNLRFLYSNFNVICGLCNEYFFYKFHDFEYMDIECKCRIIRNCTLDVLINKYYSNSKIINGCERHKNEKGENRKFIKYCKDCKVNLCEECLKVKSKFNNNKNSIKVHETHNLIDLLSIKEEINDEDDLYLIDKNKNDKTYNLKNIIINLRRNYENFPSYNAYKAIKSIIELLKKSDFKTENQILKFEELKKINSIKSLKENINNSNIIYKIEINGNNEEILEDLNIFENKKFNELKKLQLKKITKLKDIKALSSCYFPNLKTIEIEEANLTDDCIDIIKKLKLPKIKFISFFSNKITSPEILNSIKNFESLETFYIGDNPIDIKKLPNKNYIYEFPPNLIKLGLTKNFTRETNEFISNNLNIENIKSLYINYDGITSLKMFKNIKFKQIEDFWIRGDDKEGVIESIEEIKYFQNKKNIKRIVLKENKIKDIEKFVDIAPFFPKLELLNIEDNDIKKEKIVKVIEKLKEKGFEKLIIKYN